jgi:transcriptional regulator with XRE-family HTH domain
MNTDLPIGLLIQQVVEEQGLTKTAFAEVIHCSRSNINSIYQRTNIDVKLLALISEALDYDFFAAYKKKSRNEKIHHHSRSGRSQIPGIYG